RRHPRGHVRERVDRRDEDRGAAPEGTPRRGGRPEAGDSRQGAALADAPRAVSSVDVPVALLGYGTVGAAVNRLLVESADDIERATGHRLRVVRALVRDPAKERGFRPDDGVLTTDFAGIRDDPSIALVAEVMGGLEPTGGHVLDLLRAGKPVVSANKQLVARRGA